MRHFLSAPVPSATARLLAVALPVAGVIYALAKLAALVQSLGPQG